MQRTICCDDVSTTDTIGTPPIFKFGEKRCSQNSESRKTSRYYKKTTTTLNLNIQQILINASCLVIDPKNDCIKRFESSTHELLTLSETKTQRSAFVKALKLDRPSQGGSRHETALRESKKY